jgi:hypothetical protein
MAARDVTRNQGTMGGLTYNRAGGGPSTFSLDGVTANDTGRTIGSRHRVGV